MNYSIIYYDSMFDDGITLGTPEIPGIPDEFTYNTNIYNPTNNTQLFSIILNNPSIIPQ